ncbi:MAG: lipid-A-disaccharide synthase [Candidatus Margulisiibacteriota bacterium]
MKIFISTGEISGDIHGAALADQLHHQFPGIELTGLGSVKMKAAGVKILTDISSRSTIGFVEPLVHLPFFLLLWTRIKKYFKNNKPDLMIMIDAQGINLPLARLAKKAGIPRVYYIPPQEWIWGTKKGAREVVDLSDLILAVFQKEKQFYKDHGGQVIFVGHPIIDLVKPTIDKESFFAENNFNPDKKLIGLFPGSRKQEITNLLPSMIKTVINLPDYQYAISVASEKLKPLIKTILDEHNVYIRMVENSHYDLLNNSDIVLTSSGTTTLEATCLHKPMVVIYRLSRLTWFIAKYILKVKVKFIALPNILADARIVPEFILNHQGEEAEVTETIRTLLETPLRISILADNLETIAKKLGEPGAAKRAAEQILNIMK